MVVLEAPSPSWEEEEEEEEEGKSASRAVATKVSQLSPRDGP